MGAACILRSCGRSGPPDRCGRSPRRPRRTWLRVSSLTEASPRRGRARHRGSPPGRCWVFAPPGSRPETAYDYLVANERELQSATDIELAVMAEAATGARLGDAVFALHRSQPSGRPDRSGDQLDRLGNPCVRPGGDGRRRYASRISSNISADREDGVGSRGLHRTRTTRRRSSRRSARKAYEAGRSREGSPFSVAYRTPTAALSSRPGGVPTHSRRPGRSRRSSRRASSLRPERSATSRPYGGWTAAIATRASTGRRLCG